MSLEYSASNIEVLSSIEAVRKRPAMYFGSVGPDGMLHLLWEVVGNAIDEHLAGHATWVKVTPRPESRQMTVTDDGRGMLHGRAVSTSVLSDIFTELHNTPTRDNHFPHVHITNTLTGVGLAGVNAVCEHLRVGTLNDGTFVGLGFTRGEPYQLDGENHDGISGTKIEFVPDTEIFADSEWDHAAIIRKLSELAYLLPDLTISYGNEIMGQGSFGPTGLSGLNPVDAVIRTRQRRGDLLVDLAMGWEASSNEPSVRSFVSLYETKDGGTHVEGFWQGVERGIVLGLDNAGSTLTRETFRLLIGRGLKVSLHVGMYDPMWQGPTHSRLGSPEVVDPVSDAVESAIAGALMAKPVLREKIRAKLRSR